MSESLATIIMLALCYVLLFTVIAIIGLLFDRGDDEKYQDGYDHGYGDGFVDGFQEGHDAGITDGMARGAYIMEADRREADAEAEFYNIF